MTLRLGINGFGRMGRMIFRIVMESTNLRVIRVNDPGGDAGTFAHLLCFDSVHGRWNRDVETSRDGLSVDGRHVDFTGNTDPKDTDWSDCDLVIEASGMFRSVEKLAPYRRQGVSRIVVTAPVADTGVLNIVMGVNHHQFSPEQHAIVTAASCTTNCLAPVVKVIHENLIIRHGSMTTVHAVTSTQKILDAPHKDLRRARACGLNLIPTTTGSARAIGDIFPELAGKLNGHAIRVPLANVSLTDCVFEVEKPTSVDEVNGLLEAASKGFLKGILGYEERPLVSIDYQTDPRSSIVDALSTLVVNGTQIKIFAWYDNEWGYANRVVDLVRLVGPVPNPAD